MSGIPYIATLALALAFSPGAQNASTQNPPANQAPATQNPATQTPGTQNPTTQNPTNQNPAVSGQTGNLVSPTPGVNAGGGTTSSAAPMTPTFVNVDMNQPLTMGSLSYRIVDVRQGLPSYSQQYDQRHAKLTPGYKTDRLVVLDVEVTNNGKMPAEFTDIAPAIADKQGELTDRAQWDVRQQSYVRSDTDTGEAALRFYSSYLSPDSAGTYGDVSDAVKIAPQGKVRFALIFSEPANAGVGHLRLETGQMYGNTPWTIGQVDLTSGNGK